MTMNGIKDFNEPQYMDIVHPERGFFGYLLRCKCLVEEKICGNFIFLDDGTDCCRRFPTVKKRREEIRAEWNGRAGCYQDIFEGQLYYVREELIESFHNFMTCGTDDEVRLFLMRFVQEVRSTIIYNSLGIEPLYAVSHISQLADDDRVHRPHIHVLWGIKKK